MSGVILEIDSVRQEFGGLTALDDVSIEVRQGEIHGLIGPNGAGKTTLINVLTGIYRPTAGRVLVDGRDITGLRPDLIYEAGVARTFQNIRLWPELSLRDNVMIGAYRSSGIRPWDIVLRPGRVRAATREMREISLTALRRFGLEPLADEPASRLPYGRRRLLEMARACVTTPKLLLLDEPAAGLNPAETDDLAQRLSGLVSLGTTVVLIEHNVRFVMELCQRISVLNFGRKLMTGTPAEVQGSPDVIEAYLGTQDQDAVRQAGDLI